MPQFQAAEHHELIAKHLERVERGECKRLIIEAPPRHTKSELASRRFPSWFIGRNPDKQIIAATYNAEFAGDFGREVRNIVGSEDYANVFQGVELRTDSKAANRWHTNHGGVYVSAGVGTALTGRGGHIALIDDPFKDRFEADNERRRELVWNWYRSVLYTRLMPGGAIVLINTRWHEDDLAGRILEQAERTGEHWEVIKLPAIRKVNGEEKALWPDWFPLDVLRSIRDTIGSREWLSLYQQQPTAEDGTFFHREWFRWYDSAPKNLNVYISGDFAVTDGGGDFTELGVWGVDEHDNIYALDWWSGQTTSLVWMRKLVQLIKRYKPLAFIGEGGPIRRAVEPILRKTMRQNKIACRLEWLAASNSKEAHARTFQALAENGYIYLPTGKQWAEELVAQLLKFPAGKHDDKVDTCSLMGRHIDHIWNAVPKPKKKGPTVVKDLNMRIADFEPNDGLNIHG